MKPLLLGAAIAALLLGTALFDVQAQEREFPQMPGGMSGHRMTGQGEFPMMGSGMMGQWNQGTGGGMGPGMMMGGMMGFDAMMQGMMGMSPGMLSLDSRVPPEKRDQIRNLHLDMMQSMLSNMAAMQSQRIAIMKALHAVPMDQGAARSAQEAMFRAMGTMMAARIDTMAKVQQILGKELWEEVHPEWFGPRMGMGPQGMAPSR